MTRKPVFNEPEILADGMYGDGHVSRRAILLAINCLENERTVADDDKMEAFTFALSPINGDVMEPEAYNDTVAEAVDLLNEFCAPGFYVAFYEGDLAVLREESPKGWDIVEGGHGN